MNDELPGLYIVLATWAVLLWGAFGRGSFARAVRVLVSGRDDP